ncbi:MULTISPECIES: baseplate J/gp47 family protein [unclassified Acinetobacter]|uniref:baseplate J/gp47 family protein n=1 Tax=unclassified Acinetobacter TaxID=196816 RepID=UPI0024488B18|nr:MULTISPECIES: baseplate J/gp47 family protein [unclassified Acinetobacter]MDH0030305.1 baseplate J/gp47 family protein [Acinetobacter sp. GD04021]MDH0885873.1 baseplate J/gp47 family protein [Acinetobacter sp. GD03873]MDH1082493.1 baseplate J/gp47 family protein [Acinetobacter sp. GD03983]MDH2189115.1 baseplate J/gp47 family protein [Acinetobacter sp. GD03645]MDH2202303.1 baseplate J/gp47 family protein [Acinetobacter sp. GD03647]
MSYVTIDENGVSASTFEEILLDLKNEYKGIYGNDVYLENDSQDGQFLALIARAISDTAAVAVGVYNSFSPVSALGEALSRNVAINGITRAIPTNSFAPVVISGAIGTTIKNGIVGDGTHRWFLPTIVIIDNTGSITVNAVCESLGAISATPHNITNIITPTRGWVSVDNPNAAVLGNPVENDATLRQRQIISTTIPSLGLLSGALGAIANLDGVTRYRGYENDSDAVNDFGMSPHSVAFVISGGDEQQIAEVIQLKKTMGCATDGDISRVVVDPFGNEKTIKFYRPTVVTTNVVVNIVALNNYNDSTGLKIKQSVADYINRVEIGGKITQTHLYIAAALNGSFDAASYEIASIWVNDQSDLLLNFNELAVCTVNNVSIGIT